MENAIHQKTFLFAALTSFFFYGLSQPVNKNRSYALSKESFLCIWDSSRFQSLIQRASNHWNETF